MWSWISEATIAVMWGSASAICASSSSAISAPVHDPAHDASPAPTLARGTARTTGLLYLALAITGMLGYLLVRTNLLVPDDPAATMANLLDRELAITPLAASAADAAGQVQRLYLISENLWGVGAIFFGLWLVPMGCCALRSGWMPRPLGWVLIAGGVGYVLSAGVSFLAPDLGGLAMALTMPASIGEFWMVGYLLWRGLRRPAVPSPN